MGPIYRIDGILTVILFRSLGSKDFPTYKTTTDPDYFIGAAYINHKAHAHKNNANPLDGNIKGKSVPLSWLFPVICNSAVKRITKPGYYIAKYT